MALTRREIGLALGVTAMTSFSGLAQAQGVATGRLFIPRYAPALASNGQIAIISGGAPIGIHHRDDHHFSSHISTIEAIDPISLEQRFLASAFFPRANHASVWADNKLWLIGGRTREDVLGRHASETERIDIETHAIWRGPDLPLAVTNLTSAVNFNETVYIFGGDHREAGDRAIFSSNRVFACPPPYTEWQERAPMQLAAGNVAPVLIGNRIFVTGGYDRENAHAITQIYDPAADTWSLGPPPPRQLSAHASAALNGRLYCFGDYQDQTSLLGFDVTSGDWRNLDLPFMPRRHVRAATVGDRIVVAGGNQSSLAPAVDAVESFDGAVLSDAFEAAG